MLGFARSDKRPLVCVLAVFGFTLGVPSLNASATGPKDGSRKSACVSGLLSSDQWTPDFRRVDETYAQEIRASLLPRLPEKLQKRARRFHLADVHSAIRGIEGFFHRKVAFSFIDGVTFFNPDSGIRNRRESFSVAEIATQSSINSRTQASSLDLTQWVLDAAVVHPYLFLLVNIVPSGKEHAIESVMFEDLGPTKPGGKSAWVNRWENLPIRKLLGP